jgi:hypothetical protein
MKKFHTIKQIAELLDASTRTVRRWIDAGLLVAHRFEVAAPVWGIVRIAERGLRVAQLKGSASTGSRRHRTCGDGPPFIHLNTQTDNKNDQKIRLGRLKDDATNPTKT